MSNKYAMVYHPHQEMAGVAYEMMEHALNNGQFSNAIIPIRETRTPIVYALFERYNGRVAYGPGKVPKKVRRQLLMRELRHIVEEAAVEHGLERRNVVPAATSGNPLEGIVLENSDGVGGGGSVYWVRDNAEPSDNLLTDHLGPEP